MAQGLVASFDMAELEKAIKVAEKQLTYLVNHSEEAAKRVNDAMKSIGKDGIDLGNVNDAARRLLELRNTLKLIQEETKVETDETIVRKLENDATACIDEINQLVTAIGKINEASIGKGFEDLSLHRLNSLLVAQRAKLAAGGEDVTTITTKKRGWYTQKEEHTEFREYTNDEIQEIVNNIAVLESMIRQRLTPTIGVMTQAQKQALADKKAEMLQDKENYELWLQQMHTRQQETEKLRKSEEERMRAAIAERLTTPQGALDFASSAQTQGDMEQALKYLDVARKNVNVTTKEGIKLNDELIKKYSELKTKIEELEGKTKDQNTLVATESAKYARLLRDINKYQKALEDLRKSEDYQNGDAEAHAAEQALLAEIQVLEDRKKLYAQNAESIKQAETLVAAETAKEKTAIILREEQKRNELAKQEEQKRLELAKKYAGMSPKEAERAIDDVGIAAIEREQRAIAHLIEQKYKLDSANENYVDEMKQYDEWIDTHKSNIDKLTAALKKQEEQRKKDAKTPEGALKSAKEAKSVNELIQAYKNLDAARKSVDVSTKDGKKQFNELTAAMNGVNSKLSAYGAQLGSVNDKHNELLHTGQQLKRALTGIFSVSAIKNYINRLIEVRGEFELQNRSLQALLQNKDEADKLWDKTLKLATRSPFRVKELVTYTKQLAAYRVESDKLYDTTTMLADISAGLGVDMQRLILAYGQVKAANYLRGTELRQFSEAGINVLGELSKYFTELEGRAVSVGDVFERVSKRMVSFADVEEVLQRVTSEGGMFYNMQEQQAETLGAMRKNLQDSIDIMINEIGKSNESVLKNTIKLVKRIVDNWHLVADIATPTIAAMAANLTIFNTKALNRAIAGIGRLGDSFKIVWASMFKTKGTATILANIAGSSVWSAWGVVIGVVAAAVGGLVMYLTRAQREAKQLNKEINKIKLEDTGNLEKEIALFSSLVHRYGDANTSATERKTIISQLNSQYGEYLGFVVDETTAYNDLAAATDKVVYSLTQKAKANTLEKIYNKATESYVDMQVDAQKKINKYFEKGRLEVKDENGKTLDYIPSDKQIESIIGAVKKVSETAEAPISSFYEIADIISDVIGLEVDAMSIAPQMWYDYSQAVWESNRALKKYVTDVQDLYKGGSDVGAYFEAMTTWEAKAKKTRNSEKYKEASEPEREKIERELAEEKYTIQFTYELKPEEGSVDDAVKKAMDDWDKHSNAIKKFNEEITKKLAGKDNLVINAVFQEQGSANTKSVNQLLDEFVSGYKNQEEEIKRLNGLKKEGAIYSQEENAELEKQLSTATDLKQAYYEAIKLLGGLDLLPENQKQFNDFKKRISLIEEMRKKYEELRKYYSEEDAIRGVQDAYGDAWKEVGGSEGEIRTLMLSNMESLATYIENTLIPLIELLPKKYQKEARQLATKAAAGFRAEFGLDEIIKPANKALRREVENLFENYELSVDLKKLNVPSNLAKKLFGLETIDLKELRDQLTKMKPLFVGTELEDYYAQMLERLANMEDKDRKERLKKYLNYTRDAIGDRAKIKLEELTKLQEIEDAFQDGETKRRAQRGVRKEAKDALNKYDWEQFKSSDVFANIFNDLEEASATSIQYAIDQIKKYKAEWADMPVTEAKEMIKRLNELEIALATKDMPWDNIETLTNDLEQAMSKRGINTKKDNAYATLREQLVQENVERENNNRTLEEEISKLEVLAQLYDENKLVIKDLTEEERKLLGVIDETSVVDRAQIAEQIDVNQKAINSNNELTNSNNALLAKIKALAAEYQTLNDHYQKWIDTVGSLYSSVRELVEVFWDVSEANAVWWDLGEQFVTLTSQAVQYYYQMKMLEVQATATGVAMNAALGPIGWIVLALQAIVAVVKSIVNYNQAKIDEQIESHYEKIEKLQKEYEQLEKSIEEAYDIQQLKRYNEELQKKLDEQKKAAAEAKAAAEDGKNNEKNQQAAEDAQEKYDELLEESAEKAKELFSEMTAGIFDDSISAAEGFIDAWLEAYQEVGDGMSGLTDHLEEELMNVAKRQAAYQIVGQYVEYWKSMLNGITEDENFDMDAYIQEVKKMIPKLSAELEEYYKNMPLTSDKELSGIQKGIQGITADQADVLAAYWNSVRFLTASIDQKFDIPLSRFFSDDVTFNPMLNQLRQIAGNTAQIRDLLSSVIDLNGGKKALRMK